MNRCDITDLKTGEKFKLSDTSSRIFMVTDLKSYIGDKVAQIWCYQYSPRMGSSNFVYYPPTQTVYKIGAELKRVSDEWGRVILYIILRLKPFIKLEQS